MPNDKRRDPKAGSRRENRTLGGPGLLESRYEDALFHELRLRGILKLGIVANFGQSRLIDGWERVVNDL